MPYGNKDLHFGHIGGVFVHADAFARFMRDRIGGKNVIFVSGTDCYGSPIVEYHRNAVASGEYEGSLEEFVAWNHGRQREVLEAYQVSLDLFAASGMEPYGAVHREMGAWFLRTLFENGHLEKRTTPQFYDEQMDTFLNGRQVIGKCPVQGCRSEKGYADECDLGHQYEPRELIDPRSTLSGEKPVMRSVTNWYLRLPEFRELIRPWLEAMRREPGCRQYMVSNMLEYFEPPVIHVTMDQEEALDAVADRLPPHTRSEGRGKSLVLQFEALDQLDAALAVLVENNIRYRTGKTLVPFRLTGNLEWGLPAPELDGLDNVTFWVWPESLWAPVSFTAALLRSRGASDDAWKRWWCDPEAGIYQFIGEDNIFFYGLAEAGLFLGMQGREPSGDPPAGELQLPHLVANRHIMFLDKKASSSGKVKPPMARDILEYYTSDQLRAHFLSLALAQRSVGFRPKPLNPDASEKEGDPVLKEGNLLSNTFNRAARSCFYTAQKYYDGRIPTGEISGEIIELSEKAVLDFEELMARCEFHSAIVCAGDYIREINKRWNESRPFNEDCDPAVRRQALIDAFHMVRTAMALMHPVAPEGTEMIREYIGLPEEVWGWENIFKTIYELIPEPENHRIRTLEPKVDFFPKHASQVREYHDA
jgi:methionyl-tRNA synthetase